MKLAVTLSLVAGFLHAADPRIVFTKTFPGSVPAYVEIAVDKTGVLLVAFTSPR